MLNSLMRNTVRDTDLLVVFRQLNITVSKCEHDRKIDRAFQVLLKVYSSQLVFFFFFLVFPGVSL